MQEGLNKILEENLRDIHLPEPISWWPLAFGWWVLFAIFLLAITALTVRHLRRKKAKIYRGIARAELLKHYEQWQQEQNSSQYLQNVNAVLRRCAMHASNKHKPEPTLPSTNKKLAGLTGQHWGDYLALVAPGALSSTSLHALTTDCYQPNPNIDSQKIEGLHLEALEWLRNHQFDLAKGDQGHV